VAKRRQMYIAWVRFQRRPGTMRDYFGYQLYFLPSLANNIVVKVLLSYPIQTIRTLYLVMTRKPDVLWIQAPPNFLAHIVWFARLLRGGNMTIVADMHNSALSPLWLTIPFTRQVLKRFDVVLVHNAAVVKAAIALGISPERLRVLEDQMPSFEDAPKPPQAGSRRCIVMPCSFYKDEPVSNVIEAARSLPDIDFFITGNRDRAEKQGYLENVPSNVTFTGYLQNAEYDQMILTCTGMLCLTTEEDVQLSSASEALGVGKPMIISDTPVLRSLFCSGLFIDNSVPALRDACLAVVRDYQRYSEATRSLQTDHARRERWQSQAADVKSALA
jgi:glycosyltransferase involved in cell wall biosynthesis